jgi:glycosyltransferase involved in cell wall biosynthesis
MLDIIIPVYNEGENISDTLDEINTKVKIENRLFIVYDFDEDNTLPAVKNYINEKKKENILLLKNDYGKGVLNAIKKGFDTAEHEMILVVMGDLSDDLCVVDDMYKKMQEGYDIVCGSRYMKGGKQIGGPLLKKSLSRMAGLSLHILTGIPTHDISNSFKMYRKSIIKNTHIESTGGFEIGLEILVKAYLKGHKITEVPSIWKDRAAGNSNFKLWKWLPKYIKWYLLAIKGRFIHYV